MEAEYIDGKLYVANYNKWYVVTALFMNREVDLCNRYLEARSGKESVIGHSDHGYIFVVKHDDDGVYEI